MSDVPRPVREPILIIPGEPPPPQDSPIERYRRRAKWLFGLTLASTFIAGAFIQFPWAESWTGHLANGAAYSLTIMSILLAHEMGHYLQALRYRVPATPPLFIPMPISPMGTMGAVILQGAGFADRRAMFDIAVSGPLAGLVLALPAAVWGIWFAKIVEVPPGSRLMGDPLLVKAIVRVLLGPVPSGHDFEVIGVSGRIYFAGWVGILITGLNLVPLGQLDGGHILYTLIGRRQHAVARIVYYGAWVTMIVAWLLGQPNSFFWVIMLILVGLMGIYHPPTRDDRVRLGPVRTAIGCFTLSLFFVCFVPVPYFEVPKPVEKTPPVQRGETGGQRPAADLQISRHALASGLPALFKSRRWLRQTKPGASAPRLISGPSGLALRGHTGIRLRGQLHC